jgi:hypothetical protein
MIALASIVWGLLTTIELTVDLSFGMVELFVFMSSGLPNVSFNIFGPLLLTIYLVTTDSNSSSLWVTG